MLLGFQSAGGSSSGRPEGWKTFNVERMQGLRLTSRIAQGDRVDYDAGNLAAIAQVHCRV